MVSHPLDEVHVDGAVLPLLIYIVLFSGMVVKRRSEAQK